MLPFSVENPRLTSLLYRVYLLSPLLSPQMTIFVRLWYTTKGHYFIDTLGTHSQPKQWLWKFSFLDKIWGSKKCMGIYIYTPYAPRGWGRRVWIFRVNGVPVYPTKYKKRIYQRKSIRKVISQCVCLLYTHTYPPYQTGYAPHFGWNK